MRDTAVKCDSGKSSMCLDKLTTLSCHNPLHNCCPRSFYFSCLPVILLSIARHWVFHIATSTAASSKGSPSRTTALLEPNSFETSSGRQL